MKKVLLILLLLITTTATAQKKRLAVLDFTPHNLPATAARTLRSRFELALFRHGTFELLERDKIDLIAREHRVSVKCATDDCAVRLGKLVSADYIAIGTIEKDRDTIVVLRIVDVAAGTIAYADSVTYENEGAPYPPLDRLASRASDHFSPVRRDPRAKNLYAVLGGGIVVPRERLSTIAGNAGAPALAVGVENLFSRHFFGEIGVYYGELPGRAHLKESSVMPFQFTVGHEFVLPWRLSLSPVASFGISRNRVSFDGGRDEAFEPVAALGGDFRLRGSGIWFVAARSLRSWFLEEGGPLVIDTHLLSVGFYL